MRIAVRDLAPGVPRRAAGHPLLRELAGSDAPVGYSPHGAPRVAGFAGSLSTRAGRIAAAVIREPGSVGVDLEDPAAPADPLRLARLAFVPEEAGLLAELSRELGTRAALAALWAMKEAAAKCLSVSFAPRELPLERIGSADFRLRGTRTGGSALASLRFRPEGALILAVGVAAAC